MNRFVPVLLSVAIVATTPAAVGAEPSLRDYEVQKGESCSAIARKVWGSPRLWRRIHKYNRQYCHEQPFILLVGTVLRLPLPGTDGAEAEVTGVQRKVEARPPSDSIWRPAARGTDLFRGWRVTTGEQSAAELTFRDDSVVLLRENALVIIYGQAAVNARRQTTRARLERGALRSRLAELAGRGLTIETVGAKADFSGGSNLVTVDETGTSRVANFDGGAATVTAKGGTVKVDPGMGSKVPKGKRPRKPRPLPPAPAWADAPTRFGPGVPLRVQWQPVQGASRYRVAVSREPDGSRPVAAAGVDASANQVEIPLPPGAYHVAVSTIDGDAFEGKPSPPRAFALSAAVLTLPGGVKLADANAPVVPVGTRVVPPKGITCGLAGAEVMSDVLVLEAVGRTEVTCRDVADRPVPGAEVTVAAVETKVAPATEPLQVGRSTTLTFGLVSEAPLPEVVELVGPESLGLSAVTRAPDGRWSVTLAPTEASTGSEIQVMSGPTRLGAFAVTIEAAPAPVAVPPPPPPIVRQGRDGVSSILHPTLGGTRNLFRGGIGGWIAVSPVNVHRNPQKLESAHKLTRFRVVAGAEANLLEDRLRLTLSHPIEMEGTGDLGPEAYTRQLYVSAAGQPLRVGDFRLNLDVGAWIGLSADAPTRIAPGLDVGWRVADRVELRTHQGGVIGLGGDAEALYRGALAVDLFLFEVLIVGVEATLGIGEHEDAEGTGRIEQLGVGLPVGIRGETLAATISPHFMVIEGDDQLGQLLFVFDVRGTFGE